MICTKKNINKKKKKLRKKTLVLDELSVDRLLSVGFTITVIINMFTPAFQTLHTFYTSAS